MARKPGQRATKFGCKGFRLLRSWTTLLMLAEPGSPPTAAELTERLRCRYPFDGLEISIQTTRDDLRLLRQCGFPVVPLDDRQEEIDLDAFDTLTGRLKNVRWTLRDPARLGELLGEGLPRPSAADIVTLDLLRCLLGHTAPPGFWLAATVRRLLDEVSSLQRSRPDRPSAFQLGTGAVRLRISAKALPILLAQAPEGTVPEPTGRPGEYRVELAVPVGDATERLILSLGEHAVVEEPPSLRNRIAQRLDAARRLYRTEDEPPD